MSSMQDLKQCGKRLGFSALGVVSADWEPHTAFYDGWLARGFAADMVYLAHHAELKRSVRHLLPNAQSVIVVALDYNQPLSRSEGGPKIARYALGRDYHKVIRTKLRRLAEWMRESFGPIECRICVDSAPILERDFAQMAGLGWFGKNTCLIDSRRGSWFFLGVLLTSQKLAADRPAVGGCGSCTLCIDACPTGAIVLEEERWQIDSRKCISYQTIENRGALTTPLYGWTFGCDVCQEVCPFNQQRKSQPDRGCIARDPELTARMEWPTLEELSTVSEGDWDRLTRGSAVRRAGHRGLMRNAQENLRQSGG